MSTFTFVMCFNFNIINRRWRMSRFCDFESKKIKQNQGFKL